MTPEEERKVVEAATITNAYYSGLAIGAILVIIYIIWCCV